MTANPTEDALPLAYGSPPGSGTLRATPDDFVVDEILGFEPSGEGEHAFLLIEKRGENTEHVARLLARFAGASHRDVSYAGLKDRHARTTQWFSVQLPGRADPDWSELDGESLRVRAVTRNSRKLRTGAAAGNRFCITVRDWLGGADDTTARLENIRRHGVPNYFGEQRFGRGGKNVDRARALFAGTGPRPSPHQRGLYLSAARSEVFNQILAQRVIDGSWNRAIDGDVFMFPDSRSFFSAPADNPETLARLERGEIHPSAPLWGRGASVASGSAADIEFAVAREFDDLCQGLEKAGVDMARRPLRLCPGQLEWDFLAADVLQVRFELPAGAFATVVLREFVDGHVKSEREEPAAP